MNSIGPAAARLEGVNNPQLLPTTPNVPVIDVAGFLSKGQARTAQLNQLWLRTQAPDLTRVRLSACQVERLTSVVKSLEADTGIKLRVLSQAYPNTPGLAVRDYWGVDADTAVFVADPGTGNILNFNVGANVDFKVPRTFWTRLAGKYGTKFYWCVSFAHVTHSMCASSLRHVRTCQAKQWRRSCHRGCCQRHQRVPA